ncbi:YhgE/Pip family protein [Enemella sp. A6]|uniref:YhgE/Pip domain-containing protein n=1 Tax=Enemella sp. A6 TaxID=3440152 RepID=UPI003EBBFFB8
MLERAHLNRPVGWLGLIGLVLVPVIIAASFTWAIWKSDTRLDRIDAAIVNLDEPVKIDGQIVPMGRQLAAGLVTGDEQNPDLNINWVLSDPEDAAAGMASGRYAAVVTIPKDFSAAATSFGGKPQDAEKAVLQIQTSEIGGVTDPQVAKVIIETAARMMSTSLTETYLDNIYLGFNQMGEQFGELADGTQQLAEGANELSGGVREAATGTAELAAGMGQLSAGGQELSEGARKLDAGAEELASGLGRMRDETRELPGQARKLADGAGELSSGADRLATGADQLSSGAKELSTGVQQYGQGVEQFAAGTRQYTAGVREYATGVKQLTDGAEPLIGPLNQLADALEGTQMPSADEIEAALAGLADLPDGLRQIGGGFNELTTQLKTLAEQGTPAPDVPCPPELEGVPGACEAFRQGFAAGWQNGTQQIGQTIWQGYSTPDPNTGLSLADAGPTLVNAAAEVEAGLAGLDSVVELVKSMQAMGTTGLTPSEGIRQFTNGLTQLGIASDKIIAGGDELSRGAAELAGGAQQLSSGASQYAGGVEQYAGGVQQLAGGAEQLAAGAEQLPGGLQQLVDGIAQTAAGASQLSTGTGELAWGIQQFSAGVTAAAGGADELASGMGQLAAGAAKLAEGTTELAEGVAEGRDKLPHYSDADRANLKGVVAMPVTTDLAADGELLPLVSATSLLMVMALWLGALATYLLVQAVSVRTLTSSKPSWQLAWRSIWPGVAIAAVQAVALTAVGQVVVGLSFARAMGVLGILLLAGAMFVVLNHALVAWLGGFGRVVSVTLVVLSVSGAITTALPGFFLGVRPLLPLTPALDAVQAMMVGGSGIGGNLTMLLGWLIVAASASVLAVVRSRTVSASQLMLRYS